MGRSVDFLSYAQHVAYIDVDYPSEIEDEDGEMRQPNDDDYHCHWDWFSDTVMDAIQEGLPSLVNVYRDRVWDGNETRIIFENQHCQIGISEYCGLSSISIRVNEGRHGYGNDHHGIAKAWIDKVWPGIVKRLHDSFGDRMLTKVGTFSNGEGVYERYKPQTA